MSLNDPSARSIHGRENTLTSSHSQQPLDIVFENFIALLKRRKWVVIIPVLVAEAFALYSYFVLVTYTATSSLIIQKPENSSLQALSVDLGASGTQLLSSSLNKDTYLETVLLYLNTHDSFYEAAKNILETQSGKKTFEDLKQTNSRPTGLFTNFFNWPIESNKNTKTDPIKKFSLMLKKSTKYNKSTVPGFVISVTTVSPELSVTIARQMSEQSQAIITRRDLKQLEEGKNYILSKTEEITDSLSEVEKEMLLIRKSSAGPITQKGITETFSSLQSIKSELEQNRIILEQNEKLIHSITANLRNKRKNSNSSRIDLTTLAIIKRQLVALEARKRGLLSEGMAKNSPQVLSLQEEIEHTEKQLPKNISIEKELLKDGSLDFLEDNINPEIRLSELRKENWLLRTRINLANKALLAEKISREPLPEAEQKYYALNKQLEMKYILFADLSKQLFNIDVSRIAIQNRVLNIEAPAIFSVLRRPTLFPVVPMAFILAFVFGVLIATIIDSYDPSIVTTKDLPGFNYISLGNIPFIKEIEKMKTPNKNNLLKSLVFRHKLDLPQTLPFKRVRTRLIHLEKEFPQRQKVISIHSTHSGDGKSFITANLAASLAALNKKVLLIDCDLRKKALSREFDQGHTKGLSTFLENPKLTDYSSLIVPNLQPNLDLFPSGPAAQNSAELINSQKFTHLISKLRESYDFIFLDDAPFLALPDSEIIASQSDIIIVIAACNKTKVNDFANMIEHFLQYGEKPVCIILNRTNSKNQLYYYYSSVEEQKPRARAA